LSPNPETIKGFIKTLKRFSALLILIVLAFGLGVVTLGHSHSEVKAAPSQSGFSEQIVFSGLNNPSALRFSPDGRIFVAEKSGIIKVFHSPTDTNPTIFADLRTQVHNFWDRGLLGIALDPNFPTKPYIYVLYTYDGAIGSQAPRWGTPNTDSDGCPDPPGATNQGCVVSGRLSRLQANGDVMTGSEQVLINDWCQQFPSHSVGTLAFGPDGALYASGGDGANFGYADYGQTGNPCGDPPGPAGTNLTAPTGQGGALRSQDLQTSGDPVGLNGSIIRINPDTGAAMSDNPLINNSDPNAKRIIAYGLRNPFRFTFKPNSSEIWIGDVGWNDWEEINRIPSPSDSVVENFGWPCYEGNLQQSAYKALNLNICNNLYNSNTATPPFYTYNHNSTLNQSDNCPTGSSSVTGLTFQFYTGHKYPSSYNGALFMADYSRNCIWVMFNGTNNLPSPNNIKNFVTGASSPVDLEVSPEGELWYADLNGGTIRKIVYNGVGGGSLPSPWTSQDVGINVNPGNSSYSNGTFTIMGAGDDIWNNDDSFQYAYQPLSGDGTITARVAAITDTDGWAKAGVMIRETTSPGSVHAFTGLTAENGIAFQRRLLTDQTSYHSGGDFTGAPYWVRLTRSGNTFTGFQSSDGNTWTQVGSDNISMATNALVGLAVTAHNNTLFNTSTFDNVTITTPTSNKPPVPVISNPSGSLTWKVGDVINFSGSATDPEDGSVSAQNLTWDIILHHCPSNCHTHLIQSFSGVSSGSFTTPDHEYPSYLEIRLTAKDSAGQTASTSVQLNPQTVDLTFQSTPITALQLSVNSTSAATQFIKTVILGSSNSLSAPTPQTLSGRTYSFLSWSDGGAQSHNITANSNVTFTANYKDTTPTASKGLNGIYFDNIDFSGSSISRIDPTINFDWGGGSPDPSIGVDTFSVRWTGFITPTASKKYTFYTSSDDGVRLWVNNQLIINKWIDQGSTEWSGSINLTGGQKYPIKMEYYENGGGAVAQLRWSASGLSKQIIPQNVLTPQ
jgi:glucose/arabinose dehydrogenase/regulation of enolase protein 1 (concanavalin A-like superfamily)